MLAQRLERDDVERPLVRRLQDDRCGYTGLVRRKPPQRNHAPAIAGPQPRKAEFGTRRAQVVADLLLVLEELRADNRADRVAADVIRAGAAAAVPVETGQRVGAALGKRGAQHVALW